MIIGVPKEIKDHEYRIGLVPAGAQDLANAGHTVLVQQGAGEGSSISDADFIEAGAKILLSAEEIYNQAEMIIKVKEPVGPEYQRLQRGQLLFTYLHLAPDPKQTDMLVEKQITGIAYETIRTPNGALPLLVPMSEVAGRMSIQVGAFYLQRTVGGLGELLGGVPGVPPAKVVIIGGGVVGMNAAKMAVGLGARVTILDTDPNRLRYLDDIFFGQIETIMSNPYNIGRLLKEADLVIGGVLIPGASTPKLVTRPMLRNMKKNAVIVDVAVDQGGCIETTHPTTHSNPVYSVDDIIHYCVANMPGAVPRTSTFALTNVTLPYALKIANLGFHEAVRRYKDIFLGVNTFQGHITCEPVAIAQGKPYRSLETLL